MSSKITNWQEVHITNENHLLTGTARGDETAFRLIFEGYRQVVFSYAIHLLKDPGLADDTVQNVFMKIWVNRHGRMLDELGWEFAWEAHRAATISGLAYLLKRAGCRINPMATTGSLF